LNKKLYNWQTPDFKLCIAADDVVMTSHLSNWSWS